MNVKRESCLFAAYARRHENRYTKSKPHLSDKVRQKLRDMLDTEYELYEFCKQRLHYQYERLKWNILSTLWTHRA